MAAALFTVLCVVMVPMTFLKDRSVYVTALLNTVLGLIGLNLLLCTAQRIRVLSKAVLVIHGGTILTLAGAVISSFGFVATVNVYEGTAADMAYRWDIKEDIPLGVALTVRKINMEFYPVPLKVGVLRGKEKFGLFMLKTGESFSLERFTVRADSLDFPSENLRLSVLDGGQLIGYADTGGANNLPSDFPYDFRLVAYKNPSHKKVWVELMLSRGSEVIAEGTSEANSPFRWGGFSFHNTEVRADRYGLPFAGIQINNDPGRPYVFFGFAVIGIGCTMYFMKRMAKSR
ncbi:MAG TPA: hypothetical protein VN328_00115 [Thermodesulfovibrionales bacterium]|nr:hypothetical protein [Thermodesulfovibrionales bacterium]